MEPSAAKRKLAAIVAADMVGYSRLMELDEAGTHARLKAHRIELVDPTIAKTNGKIIKTTGDGMLIEFASVVDAMACAYEIQTRMARRNSGLPEDRRIDFRIGINLGDVIVEDDDIFGDGVNLAARLEQMAQPGGICISQMVRDQVGERMKLEFQDLGEQPMKNISRPVRAYAVKLEGLPESNESGAAKPQKDKTETAQKPSLAVLPFTNMSGDSEQEFFTDGLTEDIITELSRFHELTVISRNSTFTYKGRAVNVREIAKEFGVDYVVEGSVRKAGDRIRVTVQLIEGDKDQHVWAERYDRKLEDVFAIQDEVTSAIASTVFRRVEDNTRTKSKSKRPENLQAYECLLAAKVLHHRSTPEDNKEALKMVERAIALDPKYAHAHSWRACITGQSWVHRWCDDLDAAWAEVEKELKIALSLDENDGDVHRILAAVSVARDDLERAQHHQSRALNLNPNYDLVVVQQGELLTWLGEPEEGIEWIMKAMRLNPYHPERFWAHLGRAYFVARRYGEALDALKHIRQPDAPQHVLFAAVYAGMKEAVAAKAHIDQALALDPALDLETYGASLHYLKPEDRQHHLDAVAAAGMPQPQAAQ
ncbi:adenylate/guanylate cyclase domain-containing protein [Limibacillus halophilus]